MKLSVLLVICACCLNQALSKSEQSSARESKQKGSAKLNSVSTTPKTETQYQTIQQQQIQYQQQPQYHQQLQYQQPQQPLPPQLQRPLHVVHGQPQHLVVPQQVQYQHQVQVQPQVVQRAFLLPQQHNQPAAMIIIAQPAYIPTGAVPSGATQHLLNYFHGNPQARYQLLHGNFQPQQAIQQPAHTIGNYVVAVPAHYQSNIVAVPVRPHLTHAQQPQETPTSREAEQPSPLQLAEIAHIASQQYSRINPTAQGEAEPQQYHYQPETRAHPTAQQQSGAPIRSLPPIFTGFENFSPEQQEKIKAQLSEHFGAPLQPLSPDRVPLAQQAQGDQYSTKYQSVQPRVNNHEFIPSEQVKTDASSPNVSNNRSTHFTKV